MLGRQVPNPGIQIMEQRQHSDSRSSDVAQALLSGTQRRILSLMLNNPRRSYFTTQIIDLVRAGRGGVQRELKRLVGCGILDCFDQAHQKHYQLNAHCPVVPALRQILDAAPAMETNVQEALAQLRNRIRLAVLCAPRSDAGEAVLGIVSDQLQPIDIQHIFRATPDARVMLMDSARFVAGLRSADPLMVRMARGPHSWVVPGSRRGEIRK